jgi:hypothetical protein
MLKARKLLVLKTSRVLREKITRSQGILPHLCETPFEKIVPKPAKEWKIRQNVELIDQAFSTCCNKLRRL